MCILWAFLCVRICAYSSDVYAIEKKTKNKKTKTITFRLRKEVSSQKCKKQDWLKF